MDQRSKADLLRRLHAGPEVLVLPNAWDAISARIVEAEDFPVVATTSAGLAAVLGYPDGQKIPRSEMLFLIGRIASAVAIPVTAAFAWVAWRYWDRLPALRRRLGLPDATDLVKLEPPPETGK